MDVLADEPGSALVVVAHPDDETLWAGGLILLHPSWRWRIVTLCRRSDPDRAPRFTRALERLGAEGAMSDLDDGPEQHPLSAQQVETAVLAVAGAGEAYDLLLTHGPRGEYTHHRRHIETSAAATALWRAGALLARDLWHFAYEDGSGAYLPRPSPEGELRLTLPLAIAEEKRHIIEEAYGYGPGSWEWRVCPAVESFHYLASRHEAASITAASGGSS